MCVAGYGILCVFNSELSNKLEVTLPRPYRYSLRRPHSPIFFFSIAAFITRRHGNNGITSRSSSNNDTAFTDNITLGQAGSQGN